jgi:hypothetical protein
LKSDDVSTQNAHNPGPQLVSPVEQVQLSPQLPLMQTGAPTTQAFPQAPQLLLSVSGLTHASLHSISPDGQLGPESPASGVEPESGTTFVMYPGGKN